MKEVTIPKKLKPIIEAFYADSPKAAKMLIIEAVKTIYSDNDEMDYLCTRKHEINEEEIEGVLAFMQGIAPQNMLEAILASQIVVGHLLGLRKLSKTSFEDQRLGFNMLRFSAEAILLLQRERSGTMQTYRRITFATRASRLCFYRKRAIHADKRG
jgi:hypothetical protein